MVGPEISISSFYPATSTRKDFAFVLRDFKRHFLPPIDSYPLLQMCPPIDPGVTDRAATRTQANWGPGGGGGAGELLVLDWSDVGARDMRKAVRCKRKKTRPWGVLLLVNPSPLKQL